MKSVEEYRKGKLPWQYKHATDNTNQYLYTDNEIKQIQLDAMKKGMRRAVKEMSQYHLGDTKQSKVTQQAILTAAEQLTEKDL